MTLFRRGGLTSPFGVCYTIPRFRPGRGRLWRGREKMEKTIDLCTSTAASPRRPGFSSGRLAADWRRRFYFTDFFFPQGRVKPCAGRPEITKRTMKAKKGEQDR